MRSGQLKFIFVLLVMATCYATTPAQTSAVLYTPEGTRRAEGHVRVDSIVTGHWVLYHPNGAKYAEGNFNDFGMRDSMWTYWYSNGQIWARGSFNNGPKETNVPPVRGREGKWIIYHENGKLKEVSHWNMGVLVDTLCKFYKNGNTKSIEVYNYGKRNGRCFYYYDDRVLKAKGNLKNGELDGLWSFYYPDGKKKAEGSYAPGAHCPLNEESAENECMTGTWWMYNEEGKLVSYQHWDHGVKNGQWINWSDAGDTLMIAEYKNGRENGHYRRWGMEDGVLTLEEDVWYDEGVRNGPAYYMHSGTMLVECNYKDGLLDGHYREINKNNKEKLEGNYIRGFKEGVWKQYTGDYLLRVMNYKSGFLYGPYEGYSYNYNKLVVKGTYDDGRPNGEWEYFYANGKPKAKGHYVYGKLVGTWNIYFYSDGDQEAAYSFPALPEKKGVDPIERFVYNALSTPMYGVNIGEADAVLQLKCENGALSDYAVGKYTDNTLWFEKKKVGQKTSVKTYYPGGKPHFVLEQTEDQKAGNSPDGSSYNLQSYWTDEGEQTVTNGNGVAVYYENGKRQHPDYFKDGKKRE